MSYYDPYHPQYMAQPYYQYVDEGDYFAQPAPQPQHQHHPQYHQPVQTRMYDNFDDFGVHPAAPAAPQQPQFLAPMPTQVVPPAREDLPGRDDNTSPTSAAPSRTVYLGNIPSDIQPNELLDYVRSGILEGVKILPSKNCAFISFVDHQSALLFHSDCILKKLSIKGHDIRVGWGKNSPILPAVLEAIQRDGATRNVYLGNLTNPATGEMITEDELRADLSCYGVIDCIKIIPDKGIAFIHFLSILSAIRCVSNLPSKDKYLDKKCFYGKDRCAFITKTQQHNAAQYLGLAPGMEHVVTAADREFISSALVQQSAAAAQIATQAGGANNLGNRTVYLGNLHQDSSVEEICNVVRGGLLQSIRFLKERHVCFITFIDPIAAAQFYAMCQLHGLTIHNRRIKVGWGKHSGPLSNALSLAVSNGASRNIYIGNITDFNYYHPDKLREDFSKFGDIEQINFLEEKKCAFINFVNIANAIKAIDGIKSFADYKNLKINFGKDRCGNLPRQFQTPPE
ncbi:RNA-binding protein Mrn1p [Diutina catenulata]